MSVHLKLKISLTVIKGEATILLKSIYFRKSGFGLFIRIQGGRAKDVLAFDDYQNQIIQYLKT